MIDSTFEKLSVDEKRNVLIAEQNAILYDIRIALSVALELWVESRGLSDHQVLENQVCDDMLGDFLSTSMSSCVLAEED